MNYKDLLIKVAHGARFSIDFKKRTLKVAGKDVGIDDNEEYDEHIRTLGPILIMNEIEVLYSKYKYSVPSERSESRKRNYFKALPYEQLTDAMLVYGEHREVARFDLEFFVLRALQLGALVWFDAWGTWFWQSDKDKDLVILREWIEPDKAA